MSIFVKLGSAKGCQGFRQKNIRNGGRILLAVLSLNVRIKIRVAAFDTNRSVTESTQTIAVSIRKHPDSVVKSSEQNSP